MRYQEHWLDHIDGFVLAATVFVKESVSRPLLLVAFVALSGLLGLDGCGAGCLKGRQLRL